MPASGNSSTESSWAPLRQPVFRALWLAILASNVGTWVHDVAAAWVMAESTGSPMMVAAVQAAMTLPVFLFALVAGTLADIVDRRRYLIVTQLWMLSVATALAGLAQLDMLGPWVLLGLTFALGMGAAMAMPAQAATTPELVPRPMLPAAVALNAIGMNLARAMGPALGGLILAQAGPAWAFGLNALSFVAVVVVLFRWQREPHPQTLPPETFGGGLQAGLRYATNSSRFRAVLVRAGAFFLFASATPALLPILVRAELDGGPGLYGLLLAILGVGAVGGALLLPRLRARFSADQLVLWATVGYGTSMLAQAWLRPVTWLYPFMLLSGISWIAVLSSLQIAAQTSVPAWVRARALSLYIVVFSLGLASGSLLWGWLAQQQGIAAALTAAALGAVAAGWLVLRFRIAGADGLDLSPALHWPDPTPEGRVEHDRGPVLITVEYQIDAADAGRFLELLGELGPSRRRDGAMQWGIFEDIDGRGRYLEYFIVGSWLEHLRQHGRVTEEDRRVQTSIAALHRGSDLPRVSHFLGASSALPVPSYSH